MAEAGRSGGRGAGGEWAVGSRLGGGAEKTWTCTPGLWSHGLCGLSWGRWEDEGVRGKSSGPLSNSAPSWTSGAPKQLAESLSVAARVCHPGRDVAPPSWALTPAVSLGSLGLAGYTKSKGCAHPRLWETCAQALLGCVGMGGEQTCPFPPPLSSAAPTAPT